MSPLQVMDGIHSSTECVKASIQRPELIIYSINCSVYSSSNVQSHSVMHEKTGSLACKPTGQLLSSRLCVSCIPISEAQHNPLPAILRMSNHPVTRAPDCKCLCCTLTLPLNHQYFGFLRALLHSVIKALSRVGSQSSAASCAHFLALQGQACLFESLSSAPVCWLSGCLRRSSHSLYS